MMYYLLYATLLCDEEKIIATLNEPARSIYSEDVKAKPQLYTTVT